MTFDAHSAWLKREQQRKVPPAAGPAHAIVAKERTPLFKGLQKTTKASRTTRKKSKMTSDLKPSDFFGFGGSITFGPPQPPPLTPVRWADVIGQAEAKAAVREVIEGVSKHAAIYKKYGRRPPKGVLLFGPPGNGKTLLGKAAAFEMAQMHGQQAQASGFIYVKASDIFDKYFGATEKKIADLFRKARDHKAKFGYPAVLFVDEAENILGRRGGGGDNSMITSGFGSDISVPVFLAEMDGLEESAAIVLLATNRQDALDPAVIREGRIDRKVFVGRPTREEAKTFFEHYLRERPLAVSVSELAERAVSSLFDEGNALYRVQLKNGKERVATLGDFTSGAQIAYLVDAATSLVIQREISGERVEGVTVNDLIDVVVRTTREHRALKHVDALASFIEPFVEGVKNIERVPVDGSKPKHSLIEEVPRGVELRLLGPARECGAA